MKTTNLLFLTLFTYLFGVSNLAAKDVSRITGKIIDQNEQAVPYANVALIDAVSGHLVDGAVSDENGVFLIESTKTAKVKLVVSSIGFTSFESEVFALAPGLIKAFGAVSVQDEMTGLDEVTVKSTRPEIIIEADKTTINVEGTVMAEGSNALDVIGRSMWIKMG